MEKGISLVSLNVEHGKHSDTVFDFLSRTQPDVACIQEIRQADIPDFRTALDGADFFFDPMTSVPKRAEPAIEGIAIFSRLPMTDKRSDYYAGEPGSLPESDDNDPATYNDTNRMILSCNVTKGADSFRIATTHFTWSERGQATPLQRTDLQSMLRVLGGLQEFVLCGDFNMPRGLPGQGGEMFSALASVYTDNIPPHYETSIDIALHRAGKDRPEELKDKMVDGLFSTPEYIVSDVRLISGVSDHMAVVARVART